MPFVEVEPASGGDLEETLAEAVRIHLRADVPLAVLLSGGLDSSLIAALAAAEDGAALHTFTVGFGDPEFDELEPSRVVARALGTEHHEVEVRAEVTADLPEIVRRLEEPLADPSAIPLWYVCRAAAAEVKVALAGEGGDEVFGGYARYNWDRHAARIARVLPTRALSRSLEALIGGRAARGGRRSLSRRSLKLLRHAALPEAERYASWFALLSDEAKAGLVGTSVKPASRVFAKQLAAAPAGLTHLGRLQYADLRTMLACDLLLKADRMSMAHSLELRVPLLDQEVVAAGLGLPDRAKVRGVETKLALRSLVEKRLPAEIARRPKQGFEVPIDRWLREELRPLAQELLAPERLERRGLVDPAAAQALLAAHLRRHGAGRAAALRADGARAVARAGGRPRARGGRRVIVVLVLFWGSLAALAWTHVALSRSPPRSPRASARGASAATTRYVPTVSVIVAAYNEEAVIERRLENLLALDYPAEQARDRRRLRRLERPHGRARRGFAARGVSSSAARAAARSPRRTTRCAQTSGDVVAFSDANATWAPDALRKLVAQLRRPGRRLRLRAAAARAGGRRRTARASTGATSCGCAAASRGSARSPAATARSTPCAARDYVEVDPRFGHDLSLPYLMVQRGRRAVYEPEALAFEKPTPTNEDEYRRKVRMFEHCWLIVAAGRMLRRPAARLRRSSSSRTGISATRAALLHLVLLATSDRPRRRRRGLDLRRRARRPARPARRPRCVGVGIARYYVLVTLGDGRRALELPPARRARDLGDGGGDALNRALDVALAGLGARGR